MSKITKVVARQVFDSRGNPTIEAEVFSNNVSAKAICPSGASTGSYEAFEKRDFKNKSYLGKSVFNPIKKINNQIAKKLKNLNVHNQERLDHTLIKIDGTKQKKKLRCKFNFSYIDGYKKIISKIKKKASLQNFST